MKNFAIIIAFVLLVKPFWPIIEYMANYDYIATVVCENKDQPELACNGKCYLTKQLAKDASDEQENPLNKSNKTEIPQIIIFEELVDYKLDVFVQARQPVEIKAKPNLYNNLFSFEILHPPRIS